MASQENTASATFEGPFEPTPWKTRVRGGGYATLLFLGGLGLVVGGGGMATADHFSWQLVKIRHMVEPYGVQGASLAMIGIVVIGMSFVARAAVKASASVARSAAVNSGGKEIAMLADQVAANLAGVKRSISRLSEGVSSLLTTQNQVLQQLAHNGGEGQTPDQRDGLFRLAASLDKLGAQMDERLQGLDSKIRTKIDGVTDAIDRARASLASGAATAGSLAFEGEPAPPPPPPHLPHAETGVSASQEELDVLVELERELLEGKEPNLEFFDAVEEIDSRVEEEPESPSIELDVETPRGPVGSPPRQPLDVLMPEDE